MRSMMGLERSLGRGLAATGGGGGGGGELAERRTRGDSKS
jgi:hypothetical protein